MKATRLVMGMPVTVEIAGEAAESRHLDAVFAYFGWVEEKFSPFKPASETSLINAGIIQPSEYSEEMREVLRLAEKTKVETDGYFDVYRDGVFNPVGLVKGWAIRNAAESLRGQDLWDFYIEAGGDIEVVGLNEAGEYWSIGIRDPFDQHRLVKVLYLSDIGIATSGTYVRGDHIYDPRSASTAVAGDTVSLTVIGPNVYEADRLATAAFAMGTAGLRMIEELSGFEAYLIGSHGMATMTTGFEDHTVRRPLGREAAL
jgi:FAD:protein FMN transferase